MTDVSMESAAFGAMLRAYFPLFLEFAFREVGGEETFHPNWHFDAMSHQLSRVADGTVRRLVINLPPRHGKSNTLSAWVAWMLGHNPAKRFIFVSYGQELADKLGRDCLRIIDGEAFKKAFPDFKLTKRSAQDFETVDGGGRLSTSVGGVLTGRGADYIVIDDPMKADDTHSERVRAYVKEWMFGTLMSRLNNPATGAIVIVMQRLHQDDLTGEVLDRGDWEHCCMPAIATQDERVPLGGGRFHIRLAGTALHPERVSLASLEELRAQDSRVFAAQQQQDPVPTTGNYVKPGWFEYYDEVPIGGIVCSAWDLAGKGGPNNDWSVGITSRFFQGRHYILNVYRKRQSFSDLRKGLIEECRRYRVTRLLIEDASSGIPLIDMLRREPVDGVPFPIAVKCTTDKFTRFAAQASRIEAGQVVLPRSAPWLADFLAETVGFPNSKYDDQPDALAHLIGNPPLTFKAPIVGPELIGPDDYTGSYDASAYQIFDACLDAWLGSDDTFVPAEAPILPADLKDYLGPVRYKDGWRLSVPGQNR